MGQSLIPGSLEALESMMLYLVEAVSRDYGISMEAARPKALELLYASSKKLLGAMPAEGNRPDARPGQKGKHSNNEFMINLKVCKELAAELQYEAQRNNTLKSLADRLEFHLKKLEG